MAVTAHDMQESLAYGQAAESELARLLRQSGHDVSIFTDDMARQRRGIDLIVDGVYVDVKTDRHPAVNVFFELVCDGKPGAFWRSRADAWLYWFPAEAKLYHIDLAASQSYLAETLTQRRRTVVTSKANRRVWTAEGVAVPLKELLDHGVALDRSAWLALPQDEDE